MDAKIKLAVSRAEYDALPYWNQSLVKRWLELGSVPSKFKFWYDHRQEEKLTESCLLGLALDCLMIEPDQFENRFVVVPKCDRRTKEGKEAWRQFENYSKDRQLLTFDQNLIVWNMEEALQEHVSTADVFTNCKKAVITADMFGFPCKGEIDLWEDKTAHIWDLKALQDVSQEGFVSALAKFRYYIQATFYLELARAAGVPKGCL